MVSPPGPYWPTYGAQQMPYVQAPVFPLQPQFNAGFCIYPGSEHYYLPYTYQVTAQDSPAWHTEMPNGRSATSRTGNRQWLKRRKRARTAARRQQKLSGTQAFAQDGNTRSTNTPLKSEAKLTQNEQNTPRKTSALQHVEPTTPRLQVKQTASKGQRLQALPSSPTSSITTSSPPMSPRSLVEPRSKLKRSFEDSPTKAHATLKRLASSATRGSLRVKPALDIQLQEADQ